MKSQFQPRPQSKSLNKNMRPVSRYANKELAQESFKNAKELQKKQLYDKAIEQYFKSLLYDPNYFQAYCNMGSCYRAQGRYLQSRSMYIKSITIKNDDAISHYNLANVQRIIGNYENSIKHYDFVIKLGQSGKQNIGPLYPNSLINIGICYKITEQYEKAIDYYERAKKIDPNDEAVIYNQAMAYMAILQTINIDIFHEVSKERALKAEVLFKQLLKNNPNHEMAILKLYRVSSILDRSNENLNSIVTKLKQMLSNEKSTLKDEINLQLGFVLKMLKQYQQSATHYNQSFNKTKAKGSSKNIETNIYDSSQGYLNNKISIFSEQQAIQKIKEGNIDEVLQSIAQMDQSNISKHVIQLAIQLELSETESEDHFKKAQEIYIKYFTTNKTQIPFGQVSIQAHKLIGKVLSTQNKYKESIKHFEYISSQVKSNVERSAVHTSLGCEYEALGDRQKALQEYKLALQQQPQNYQLIYNVGCCIHDNGNHAQSNIYFEKFLDLIGKDTKIYLPTKNLYIADCLVTMAGSTNGPDQYKRYEKAWNAIKQCQQNHQQGQIQFDNQKMMNFYLRWTDLLEEKMINTVDKKSQDFISAKEALLEVYMCLLQQSGCPDRDPILNNCAILYYQEKLYVNALANLNQVMVQTALSLNSLALTYLHLGEHFMATKSIFMAVQKDPNDPLINFNRELIQWIYGISNQGYLCDLINNQNDTQILIRWQYAILVVDSLSRKLKSGKEEADNEIPQILQKLFKNNNIEVHLDDVEKLKYKSLLKKFEQSKSVTKKSSLISQQLLSLCIMPSHNVQANLKHLISKLSNDRQLNEIILQMLFNIFIFTNKDKGHTIRTILEQTYHSKKQIIELNMDRRVTITDDLISKQYAYSSLSDIVTNLCTWECELQSKLIVLIHFIQKSFYDLSIRDPLEFQYHFPRHNQLEDCSINVNRMVDIVYNIFNIKANIQVKGKTISAMKSQLLNQIEADFQLQMRKQSFVSISLGEKLKVFTVHANFATRDECAKFIKQIQRQCSSKRQIDLTKVNEEFVLLISGLIAVHCKWTQNNPLKNAIQSLLKSPLEQYQHAILQIDESIYFIKEADEKSWNRISKIEAFKGL